MAAYTQRDRKQMEELYAMRTASGQPYKGSPTPEPVKPAEVPAYLGKCDILKVHDDGDLTVKCDKDLYVITTEGEVFKNMPGFGYHLGYLSKKEEGK